MTTKLCQECSGTGIHTQMEPKKWGSSTNYVLLHGHLIPKNYTCSRCKGTGKHTNQSARAA